MQACDETIETIQTLPVQAKELQWKMLLAIGS